MKHTVTVAIACNDKMTIEEAVRKFNTGKRPDNNWTYSLINTKTDGFSILIGNMYYCWGASKRMTRKSLDEFFAKQNLKFTIHKITTELKIKI